MEDKLNSELKWGFSHIWLYQKGTPYSIPSRPCWSCLQQVRGSLWEDYATKIAVEYYKQMLYLATI